MNKSSFRSKLNHKTKTESKTLFNKKSLDDEIEPKILANIIAKPTIYYNFENKHIFETKKTKINNIGNFNKENRLVFSNLKQLKEKKSQTMDALVVIKSNQTNLNSKKTNDNLFNLKNIKKSEKSTEKYNQIVSDINQLIFGNEILIADGVNGQDDQLISSKKTEVQMTASFNLLVEENIKDSWKKTEEVFEKIEKIFNEGISHLNKSQTAFVLKTVGLVDDLNDNYEGSSDFDEEMISVIWGCLKKENIGIDKAKLKEFLCLLEGLINKGLLVHNKETVSESQSQQNKMEKEEIKSLSEVKNIKKNSFIRKRENSEQKIKQNASEKSFENKYNGQMSFDEKNQFSFKKKIYENNFVEEIVANKKQINKNNLKNSSNRNLSLDFKQSKFDNLKNLKNDFLHQKNKKNEENTKNEPKSIHQKNSLAYESLSNQNNYKSEIENNNFTVGRGRFLFSSCLKHKEKTFTLLIYENDDLEQICNCFSNKIGVELSVCKKVFDQIERQRMEFSKSFTI